jgi:hypothetical protein
MRRTGRPLVRDVSRAVLRSVIVRGRCHRHLDSRRPVVSQLLFAPRNLGSYESSRSILQNSIHPGQYLLECRNEPLPPTPGALVCLLLIRPEA